MNPDDAPPGRPGNSSAVPIGAAEPAPPAQVQEVRIPSGTDELQAVLARPHAPRGLVLFAHGSGSGRHSTRNRQVAHQLQQIGLATLLLDLLTLQEEAADQRTAKHRFDIPMLTQRFEDASAWAAAQPALRDLPIGYFGASTGSAVALSAASRQPGHVAAVVSRGGRPDLAGDAALQAVRAPTLLIVGGEDGVVLDLNRSALAQLRCERQLEVIPGATHLFEEPGALEQVAELARTWLHNHLARPTPG